MRAFLILTMVLAIGGCASSGDRIPQKSSNLILDVNMPVYGINDAKPSKSYRYLDTVSVFCYESSIAALHYSNALDDDMAILQKGFACRGG